MPINNGTFAYTSSGATSAAAGQTVQSAVWNSVFADIQTALGQLASNNYNGINGSRNIMDANGSFDVWQRGLSLSIAASTTAYTADRWYIVTGANQATVVARATGIADKSQYAATITRTAGQTGVGAYIFGYPLDSDECVKLRNSKIYINLVVNAGANFSPASGALTVSFYTGTGTVTKRGGGGAYTGEVQLATSTTNLVAGVVTAINLSSSLVVPLTTTQAELQFTWTPVGTAGAVDAITIDDVQVQIIPASGLVQFTAYDQRPFNECLVNCERHYRTTIKYGTTVAQGAGLSGALGVMTGSAARFACLWEYGDIRTSTPTITTYNPSGATANWQDFTATASLAVTIDTANSRGNKSVLIYGATAAATDHLIYIHASADASI